jgi:hypothetical protein
MVLHRPVELAGRLRTYPARDERSAQDITSGMLKIRELIGLTRVF